MKKNFSRFAGVIFILALFTSSACAAGYRFDDLPGPSGISYQWVVVNPSGQTFGATHHTPMDVSSDLINGSSSTVNIMNGSTTAGDVSREISTLFLVLCNGYGNFSMDVYAPSLAFEGVTPEVGIGAVTDESYAEYNAIREPYTVSDASHSSSQNWAGYGFQIVPQTNSRANIYDSVRQVFYYAQNPSATPSQRINKPVVIANVNNGSAMDESLVLRATLRDSASNGNIVAYKRDRWNAADNKTTELNDWILAPVDNINTDTTRINYYLTTEVVNNTAYRYLAQDSQARDLAPNVWKFNLPRYQGTTDIDRTFYLDDSSNIAPGLVSVFRRQFNLNETNIRPLRISAVDYARPGLWDLVLQHSVLFVKKIGETYSDGTDTTFKQVQITAFEPNPSSLDFYVNMAKRTGSSKDIKVPTTFQTSAINRNSPHAEAIEYFTINYPIPGSLRTSTTEMLLPLQITMNIPVTKIKDTTWWNTLVDQYRSNGDIADIFSQNMSIYLMAGEKNILNMTQELNRIGAYQSQVRVFLDEERGQVTNDNDKGVITVSFVIFLMNATRDGVRPELSIVYDTSKNYIAVRDGSDDNNLYLNVFIAPSDYHTNDTVTPNDTNNDPDESNGGGGSGGGCNAGFSILSAMTILFALNYYKKGRNF